MTPPNGTLIVLIGPAGSGKSTFAASRYGCGDVMILSSDAIRTELTGSEEDASQDAKVFDLVEQRARDALREGRTVVIDATNLTRKRRARWLAMPHARSEAVVFYRDVEKVLGQNARRDRQVPDRIVMSQWRRLEFPVPGEGFDKIDVIDDISPEPVANVFEAIVGLQIFQQALKTEQQNRYHLFTVGEHSLKVVDWLRQIGASEDLVLAGLLHDLGKLHTATQVVTLKRPAGPYEVGERVAVIERRDQAWRVCDMNRLSRGDAWVGADDVEVDPDLHYYHHENVSAYWAWRILRQAGLDTNRAVRIAQIIQLHMRQIASNMSERTGRRLQLLCGDLLPEILTFREADKVGSGTQDPDQLRQELYRVRDRLLYPGYAPVRVWYLMRPYLASTWEETLNRFRSSAQEWERQALATLVETEVDHAVEALRGMILRIEPRYVQFNYGNEVAFERRWNPFTLEGRGVILDRASCRVIARPFYKFFNANEVEETQHERIAPLMENGWNVSIADKVDGVLGILWLDGDDIQIGTRWNLRGSPPAEAGREMLYQEPWRNCHDELRSILREHTLMVEIVHHRHQIIVPYDKDQLVLIGGRNLATGTLWTYGQVQEVAQRLGVPHARVFPSNLEDVLATYSDTPATESEGIVLMLSRYEVPIGEMAHRTPPEQLVVKFKWQAYLNAAQIVSSGASWRQLIRAAADNRLDDLLANIPDDVRGLIQERVDVLVAWGREQQDRAWHYFEQLQPFTASRQAFAEAAS